MTGGIYTITAPSGHQYVGSTTCFTKRWSAHRRQLERGTHCNRALTAAFAKYGPEGLVFARLLVCAPDMLVFHEQQAIDTLNPKYNACRVAGSVQGLKQSAETKAKRAASLTGRAVSPETRERIAAAQRGRPLAPAHVAALCGRVVSAETRAKISASKKANCTPELRARLSAALMGRKLPPRSSRHCENIAAAAKGRRPVSEETRQRMSEAATRKYEKMRQAA